MRSVGGGPGHRGDSSDHFDGERFFNREGPAGRSFLDTMRWWAAAQRTPWPRWVENRARPALPARPQHMSPAEAVRAHLDLGARVSVGTHFGCSQLTDEGIDDPLTALDEARKRHGVSPEAFHVLETGETRVYRRCAQRPAAC